MRGLILAVVLAAAACVPGESTDHARVNACEPELPAPGLGDEPFPALGNPGYDVESYLLDLRVDPRARRLRTNVGMRIRATARSRHLAFDYTGSGAPRIWADGVAVETCTIAGKIVAMLPTAVRRGSRSTIRFQSQGWPDPIRKPGAPFEEGWIVTEDGVATIGLYGAAASWFPLNATPRDEARFTLRVTVPRPLVAVAGGELAETIDGPSERTFVWESEGSVPADAGGLLAIAPFEHIDLGTASGVSLDAYVGIDADGWRQDVSTLREMLPFFTKTFGPYPFSTYGMVVTEGSLAEAYEAQARTFRGAEPLGEDLLAHHLAHQWFEHAASPETFRDVWLREGLASYAEILWVEKVRGRAAARSRVEEVRDLVGPSSTRPLHVDDPADMADPDVLFGRGVLALDALRSRVGDPVFFEILRNYTARFLASTATTDAFLALVEEIGGRAVRPVLTSWLGEPLPSAAA